MFWWQPLSLRRVWTFPMPIPFVENADHMGLSTLINSGGRVGCSKPDCPVPISCNGPDKPREVSVENAWLAIKGFTELPGFKTHAGFIHPRGWKSPGAAQSGSTDSIGYELYSQLLETAILEKQRKPKRQKSHEMTLYRCLPTKHLYWWSATKIGNFIRHQGTWTVVSTMKNCKVNCGPIWRVSRC